MSANDPRNALVTGASRGIGRGVAVALGAAGWRVFITGRTLSTLKDTARAVEKASSDSVPCTPIVCDHSSSESTRKAFETVERAIISSASPGTRPGLDLLVNNAYGGVQALMDTMSLPFWEKGVQKGEESDPDSDPAQYWDALCDVGLRSNYVSSVYATRMMVPRGRGLIVNVSSWGSAISMFDGVYSTGKAANDRLVHELAKGLVSPRDTGVRMMTLWPGAVRTELLEDGMRRTEKGDGKRFYGLLSQDQIKRIGWNMESPLYVGRVVAAIAGDRDSEILKHRNGAVVVAAEAGNLYGVTDKSGEKRYSFRSLRLNLWAAFPSLRNSWFGHMIPDLIIPWTVMLHGIAIPPVKK